MAIEIDTRLIIPYNVGGRGRDASRMFMRDLVFRLRDKRIELTTDAHNPYVLAVEEAFRGRSDYATTQAEGVHNSLVERQNLTIRTQVKRFARDTNGHSKLGSRTSCTTWNGWPE